LNGRAYTFSMDLSNAECCWRLRSIPGTEDGLAEFGAVSCLNANEVGNIDRRDLLGVANAGREGRKYVADCGADTERIDADEVEVIRSRGVQPSNLIAGSDDRNNGIQASRTGHAIVEEVRFQQASGI